MPIPLDTILLRYMNFAKFVALLQTQSLWFTRLSEFKDPQEGRFYNHEVHRRQLHRDFCVHLGLPEHSVQTGQLTDYAYERLRSSAEQIYTSSFASCWTIDEQPSDLMWMAYAPNLGIAVQTTIDQLVRSLPGIEIHEWDLHHGPCSYEPKDFNPLYQKRPKFKGEREYRVCYTKGHITDERGCKLPINLELLVSKVWVSPHSGSDWLVDVVKKELGFHGLPNVPVELDTQ